MNSFTQLMQHVKGAQWSDANRVFVEIMQQKVADRMAVVRQNIFKEDADKRRFQCQISKCKHTFYSTEKEPSCPKCGAGYEDIEG